MALKSSVLNAVLTIMSKMVMEVYCLISYLNRFTERNGQDITYDQVEKEKPFSFYKDKIQKIFDDAELLIAYNDPFDVSFLEVNGIDLAGKEQFDVMLKFNEVLKDGRKHKLTYCADWYRFNWQEDQHTSLRDVKATLYYFNEMVK